MMRHDGGDPLKSQDHHAGLRALPLKAMECAIFQRWYPDMDVEVEERPVAA
jgi:hypothetical protein